MKIFHNTANIEMTVLCSFQRFNGALPESKFVALACGWSKLIEDGDRWHQSRRWNSSGKLTKHYYMLWSPTEDFANASIVPMLTKTGRAMAYSSSYKVFQKAIEATEFVTFK